MMYVELQDQTFQALTVEELIELLNDNEKMSKMSQETIDNLPDDRYTRDIEKNLEEPF